MVWFTGLSGAGKSTLAKAVSQRLARAGLSTEVIDGDDLRQNLSAGLGFSPQDRAENARRAACLAQVLAQRSTFVLVALIAPYRAVRAEISAMLPRYFEVFVNAPLAVCEARDPKGLYHKVRSGELVNFTGVDDPYEPPVNPALEIRTDQLSIEESVQAVVRAIARGADVAASPAGLLRAALDAKPGITMAAFARSLGVTPRKLAAQLRDSEGTNFREIRAERLLAQAQLLLDRGCSVKEAAFQLGFGSPESFERFYRRVTGRCPSKSRTAGA